jgi:hypothetical protein
MLRETLSINMISLHLIMQKKYLKLLESLKIYIVKISLWVQIMAGIKMEFQFIFLLFKSNIFTGIDSLGSQLRLSNTFSTIKVL